MIVVHNKRILSSDEISLLAERLQSLASDLRSIQRGWSPTAGTLSQARAINDWSFEVRDLASLGVIGNVPELSPDAEDYHHMVLSGTWVLAAEHGWARSLSRWYRLGRPKNVPSLSSSLG